MGHSLWHKSMTIYWSGIPYTLQICVKRNFSKMNFTKFVQSGTTQFWYSVDTVLYKLNGEHQDFVLKTQRIYGRVRELSKSLVASELPYGKYFL